MLLASVLLDLLTLFLVLALLTCAVLPFSQFEKEEQVHSIDIGNEGSAFIEVLVGNSSAVRDQDYEVFLQMKQSPEYITSF